MSGARTGSSLFRTKDIPTLQRESEGEQDFRRTLSVWSLTAIGVGAIVGVGAFVLLGTAAATEAGPAVALSFIAAGVASACAALCYAELAGMIPVSGSAYTYSYAVLGEFIAWLIGWNLLLEYTLVVAVVAIGIAGYLNEVLAGIGLALPAGVSSGYFVGEGGFVNLFAVLLCLAIAGLQIRGIEESARFNSAMVILKLGIIAVVILVGAFFVDPGNLVPFFPFGLAGVFSGAALVFFAVFGFDAPFSTYKTA